MRPITFGSVTIAVILMTLLPNIPALGQIPYRVSTGFYDELPYDYYDIDASYIGLSGDIDEFFNLDGNLAALVDSSWIFMYTDQWESVYRLKANAT
ncbi:MAG TPA: hypothetical protein ENH10_00980, partial [Bacteroidetes bacterium]|nr:hypothetical protein [Bacteroidota bacterium]HEX03718.1 hypothetical protein [Bacteroidota bacterium]